VNASGAGTRIRPDDAAGVAAAVEALRAGGVIALPTDTVYGVAVALGTPGGIERLFRVKDRPVDKAIMVLVDDLDQVGELVAVPAVARRLAAAFWPGALTLVLPILDGVLLPPALTAGSATLGVRLPDHPTPRALARALGPLPTTSANPSGLPEARSAADVLASLGERVDLVLDGGPSPGGSPSTVVDCTSAESRVLREGAIAISDIEIAAGIPIAGPGEPVGR
jgi:L-threonylcarbamoyladenylate synthase